MTFRDVMAIYQGPQDAGIEISNTPGMLGGEVADIALGYVIGLARHTFEIHAAVTQGQWIKPAGNSLLDKKVALLGFGDIGKQAAVRFAACGMEIIAYDPFVTQTDLPNVQIGHWPARLDECDFIVLTCSLNAQTKHIFSASIKPNIKHGARLVNVSRGPLVDEEFLIESLQNGAVAAAALDVFDVEPLSPKQELREFRQNIFGSHNASNTIEAVDRTSLVAIDLLNRQLPRVS